MPLPPPVEALWNELESVRRAVLKESHPLRPRMKRILPDPT